MTGGAVLYVTYDGLLEPLGASQVLPYVRDLRRNGFGLEILSFEKAEVEGDRRKAELRRALAAEGIGWTPLRYHKRPNLPATAWDVLAGRRFVAAWASRKRAAGRATLVHARGYVPGLMGLPACRRGGKLLFDMRGFWVDERIQGGYWAPGSLQARIGRWMERRLLSEADHLILLTRRGAPRLGALTPGGEPPPWTVVPTCVDVDRFVPATDPAAVRRDLGIGRAPVLIHIGTVTGWYDGRLTMAVGKAFVERTGGSFVVLSRDEAEVRRLAAEVGVDPLVRFVPPEEIPRWLQGSDAGLALPRISDSKDASFPTKIAEYLACGLAVLATPIGDVADFEDGTSLRVLGGEHDLEAAVAWLARAVVDPRRPAAARAMAEARLSVAGGARKVGSVYRLLGIAPEGRPDGEGSER
ncbi:MAG: glycosyltransferase [Longimicrobiales bacterium]|nr:glycosyltransferase [Longimicrobiales bacterium]